MKTGIELNPSNELETAFHELGHAEFYIRNPFISWIWNQIDQYDLNNGAGHGLYNLDGADLQSVPAK